MPNYDYECRKCGHKFEIFQKMSAQHLTQCPKCSGALRRLIGSGAGFIFSRHNGSYASGRDPVQRLISGTGKGPGFYATDYKRKGSGGRKKKDEGADTPACASDAPECKNCPGKKSDE